MGSNNIHMKRGSTLMIAVGITILALLQAGGVGAATLTVNASGGADYLKIQDAINSANNGDIIHVAAGTYNENVFVNKSVTLRGASNVTTIINGNGNGNVVEVTANETIIDMFRITNGSNGIYVISINNVFSNNVIMDMVGGNGGAGDISSGIFLSGSANNTVTGNIIINITGETGGKYYYSGDSGTSGGISAGIYLSGYVNNTLTKNIIRNINGGTGGVWGSPMNRIGGYGGTSFGIYMSDNNTVTFNTISNITGGTGGVGDYEGGPGGNSYGIFPSGPNIVTFNIISNLTDGRTGTGELQVQIMVFNCLAPQTTFFTEVKC